MWQVINVGVISFFFHWYCEWMVGPGRHKLVLIIFTKESTPTSYINLVIVGLTNHSLLDLYVG